MVFCSARTSLVLAAHVHAAALLGTTLAPAGRFVVVSDESRTLRAIRPFPIAVGGLSTPTKDTAAPPDVGGTVTSESMNTALMTALGPLVTVTRNDTEPLTRQVRYCPSGEAADRAAVYHCAGRVSSYSMRWLRPNLSQSTA